VKVLPYRKGLEEVFRCKLSLPVYTVEVLLIRDGRLVARRKTRGT
jgi:hypothetical protein